MAQNINDNLRLHAPKLLDDRAGPYASVAAALAGIPAYQRCPGLEVVVEVGGVQKKYWFDGGIADVDLVEIPSGGSGCYEPKNSIEVDAGELQLVGDELAPGNNKVYGTNGAGVKGWKDDPAGGGHTIKDTDGTTLTQRDTLKFKGYLTATDNAVSEETEADIPEEKFSDVEFLDPYTVPAAAQALLEDTGNWTSGAYTGTAPTGCKAGMKHYDATYVFEFFTDILPIRTARS